MTECPYCGMGIRSDTLVCPSCFRDLAVPDFILNSTSKAGVSSEPVDLLRKVFHSTTEGMIVTDTNANIVLVNEAFSSVTGYRPDELLGKNPRLLKSGRQSDSFYVELWESLNESGRWQGEIWNRRKDGEIYLESLSISAVRNEKGEVTNYIAVYTDITARKQEEQRLQFLATHDPLTELPNRILFQDRLNQSLARAQRNRRLVGVLFIDLDGFKSINDTFGHVKGDRLLQVVGKRLVSSVRHSDTVARVGGDEFTGLLEDLTNVQSAAAVAKKILEAFQKPFLVNGQKIPISVSIGISIYPIDGGTSEILLRKADVALYRAKARGKNRYQFHSPWN